MKAFHSGREAKEFLISKIVAEAQRENVYLGPYQRPATTYKSFEGKRCSQPIWNSPYKLRAHGQSTEIKENVV